MIPTALAFAALHLAVSEPARRRPSDLGRLDARHHPASQPVKPDMPVWFRSATS